MAYSAHVARYPLRHIGVRGRLLLAFLGISSFAVLAAAAAVYVFLQIGGVLDRITEHRVPAALASLALSRQAERIVAAAPPLLAATTDAQRDAVAHAIRAEVDRMEELLQRLRGMRLSAASLADIEPSVAGLRDNLDALDAAVIERLSIAARKKELLSRLADTVTAAQRLVAPGVLGIGREVAKWRSALDDPATEEAARASATEDLNRAIAAFVPLQAAQFEISAINDGLLRAVAADSIADLRPLAFPLERSVYALEAVAPSVDNASRPRFLQRAAEFKALVKGPESILQARESELAVLADGEELLDQNAALSRQLTAAVDRLVAAADQDIGEAGKEADAVQRTGVGALFAVVALSLLSSAGIVWLYVGRNLIARLRALSESMMAIAGGDLRAPLPVPTGRDEIAGMAEALRVFRDTAVEVEEQNLRERQIVLDTIEYGVLILDAGFQVRMYNRAFREIWGVSEEELRARPHLRDILNSVGARGLHGVEKAQWPSHLERRLAEIAAADVPPQEWVRPDGRVLQYEITALPDGGRMLTYFDLTHVKQVETELRAAKVQAEQRAQELARSLADLRTAQDRLIQTEKLASLGQLTAGIAHEIKNPLNFINNFSAISGELIDEINSELGNANLDQHTRANVEELTQTLRGNLDKVVQHGKRADSIVRNMLLHSRTGSGEHRPADINAIVEESLNLAYHGARAEKQGFNITLEKSLDPQAGEVDIYPQEITRVLLNLISNGFYATAKRRAELNGVPYEPTMSAATRNLGDSVEIRIRDNGTGIPTEVREKIFNPFFTTKPAGEGTGLGLSLSHDIVVKQHAGTIEVETEPGAFTEFRIVLPRSAASRAASESHT